MIYFFNFFFHTKVAKLVLSGEPDNSQPFGLLLKGFFIFKLFFRKRGFLILRVEYNLKVSSIYYFSLKRVKRGNKKIFKF